MKASIQKLFPANSFARGVAVLASGTAGAQILLLLAAPILTRLYSPEDFGVLAVLVSILSILGVIASWRYELAITIAEDDQAALNVVALCLLITIGMAVLTAAAVWLLGDWVANLLSISDFANYLWLLPLGVFLIGVYQTFNYWATREKAFGRISATKLTQSISSLIIQFSLFKLGPLGLITGYITGQFLGAGRLARSAFRRLDNHSISVQGIQATASRYRRFPQFTTWAGLLNSTGQQIPFLFFAYLFSPAIVGIYAIASRVLTTPLNVVSQSVSTVFFAHSKEALKGESLAVLLISVHKKLIAFVAPVAAFMIFFGPEIFEFIFGSEWRLSGLVSSWLAVMIIFSFSTSPLSMVFTTLEMQGYALIMQANLVLMRVIGIFIGSIHDDFLMTVVYFSIFSAIGYLTYLIAASYACGASVKKIFANYLFSLLPTLILFSFFYLLFDKGIVEQSMLLCFVAIATLGYYLIMVNALKND